MTPPSRRRTGFTMIELLVVIVIIGVLIGLLVPAVMGAVRRARQAQVEAQLNTLAAALTSFKTKYGEFPPSRIVFHESGRLGTPPTNGYFAHNPTDYAPDSQFQDIGGGISGVSAPTGTELVDLVNRSVSALRSLFPKLNVNSTDFTANSTSTLDPGQAFGSGAYFDVNGNGLADTEPILLDGHECLFLFLCGVPDWDRTSLLSLRGAGGFDTNPRNPFQPVPPEGPDARRTTPFFEISSPSQLSDDDLDGVPGIVDSIGTGSDSRYIAYFSSSFGGYDPRDVQFGLEGSGTTWTFPGPIQGLVASPNPWTSSDPSVGLPRYIRPQSFQLLSAGLDRLYGPGGEVVEQDGALTFPGGGRTAEEDNVGLR